MEEYKKYVDNQHAPESLIADTLKKVQAEEQRIAETKEKQSGARKRKVSGKKICAIGMTAVAAAAALTVLVQVYPAANELNYQKVEEKSFRENAMLEEDEPERTLEEYEKQLGMDFEKLIPDGTLIKGEVEGEGGSKVSLYYEVGGSPVEVELSDTEELAPEELMSEASRVEKREVYLGQNLKESRFFAAFDMENVHVYLIASHMEKEDFEEMLEKILKN